jgi:hypothetical protein
MSQSEFLLQFLVVALDAPAQFGGGHQLAQTDGFRQGKTEDHFVSWLRLCPDNKVSGDKVIGKGRFPTKNRASLALKMAASSLRVSNTYLGSQFRRLRTKLGAPVAIKAMAAKLARLVYRMLRYGLQFVDQGAEFYETQHRKLQINYNISSGKPPNWDSKSSKLPQPKGGSSGEFAATTGKDGRTAGETCPLLLAAIGGEPPDETVV